VAKKQCIVVPSANFFFLCQIVPFIQYQQYKSLVQKVTEFIHNDVGIYMLMKSSDLNHVPRMRCNVVGEMKDLGYEKSKH
jgi:hypothetical protein